MIAKYLESALEKAHYEQIRDRNPFYGSIRGFRGVWATGRSLEDCRKNLADVLEGWILVRLRKGLPLPKLKGASLKPAAKMPVHA